VFFVGQSAAFVVKVFLAFSEFESELNIYDVNIIMQRKIVSNLKQVWFDSLLSRSAQLRNWLSNGRPTVYWMPGFFNPQGFLTAMKQEISRRHHGWALDNVQITTEITRWSAPEDVKEAPSDGGVYIHGIILEGADWDSRGQKLQDLRPGMISVSLPVRR
jgi:dynein heavy chain